MDTTNSSVDYDYESGYGYVYERQLYELIMFYIFAIIDLITLPFYIALVIWSVQ